MMVIVVKGIDKFQIDLMRLCCFSCNVAYSNEPVPRLSWMCHHIALAISENEREFLNIYPEFKPYIPFIRQHARSNTDQFLPNVSKIITCGDVTLFQSQLDF